MDGVSIWKNIGGVGIVRYACWVPNRRDDVTEGVVEQDDKPWCEIGGSVCIDCVR